MYLPLQIYRVFRVVRTKNLNVYYFLLLLLACLLVLPSCSNEAEERQADIQIKDPYALTYLPGENGTIEGPAEQTVNSGEAGDAVTAIPVEGYHFVRWSDGLDTPRRTDLNVRAKISVKAEFAPNIYTLNYSAEENGSIVGVSPQLVEYGKNANEVTAVPAQNYHFNGWSDGVTIASRVDKMVTGDITVAAVFAINQHTILYDAAENGTIKGDKEQVVPHGADGSLVTAVPAKGFHFARWSDGGTVAARTDSSVSRDLKLTAEFAPDIYKLSYTSGPNGTLVGTLVQSVNYGGVGSVVKAVAEENYHFLRWSDGVTTPERIDRNVTTDLAVTAQFAVDQHTLSYDADSNGSIVGNNLQNVDHRGKGSTVTAVPKEGYRFVSWSDGVTNTTRNESVVTGDFKVTAMFAPKEYTLRYSAAENGSLDGEALQTVEHGSDGVAVTAVPAPGYHFKAWSDGVTTAMRIEQKVSTDLTAQAAFEVNTYIVGGVVTGLVEGTVLVLQNNAGDDLTVSANGDFSFATELFNASNYEASVLDQPTSPNQTCTVTRGTGIISAAHVSDIDITCILNTYSIGGMVAGLPAGDRVVLHNNGGDELIVAANGPFAFSTPLDDGSSYEVIIHGLPEKPNWTCELFNSVGDLSGQDMNDVLVDCYPKVVLQATAGIRKVNMSWNRQDFDKVTFQLCQAKTEISDDMFDSCLELEGGTTAQLDKSPQVIVDLTNDVPYWFQLAALYPGGRKTLSEVIKAMPFGGLNDTGIDWCANGFSNLDADRSRAEKAAGCKSVATSFPAQDAFQGRDSASLERQLKKTGSGAAGFDFTKLCRNGDPAGEGRCPPNPSPETGVKSWGCTR
ncbi:MAG: InlB B-repeat-containing protein, partial [Desulfuromusa sp.]|nr:InlB B-repeat-containing protein [Desulfuromusa sp.]